MCALPQLKFSVLDLSQQDLGTLAGLAGALSGYPVVLGACL